MKQKQKQKNIRYRKWKAVYRDGDPHPRVLLKKNKGNHEYRITNAKLHLLTHDTDEREDIIKFSGNPNPEIKGTQGAFFRKLRNDLASRLKDNPQLRRWEISDDGKQKMMARLEEQELDRKNQESSKKKKQAYQSGRPSTRLLHLFPIFKHFADRRSRERKKTADRPS